MGRKFKIFLGAAAAIIFVVLAAVIGMFVFNKDRGDVEEPRDSLVYEPSGSEEIIPATTPAPTKEPEVEQPSQDRTIILDDKIKVRITGDDYVPTDESGEAELPVMSVDSYVLVNDYDFSNGFYVRKTGHFTEVSKGFDTASLRSWSIGSTVTVKEYDALHNTVQELHDNRLKTSGFREYVERGCVLIPRDAKLELDVGLAEYATYWPATNTPYPDPTMGNRCQLITDSVEECAYGEVLFTVIYNSRREIFTGYAYITCDRDRILEVTAQSAVLSNVWSSIIEVTNDSIKMIK